MPFRETVVIVVIPAGAYAPSVKTKKGTYKVPIYEFRCNNCNEEFETLVWNSRADEQIKCLNCESTDVERILSICARGTTQDQSSSCRSQSTGFS